MTGVWWFVVLVVVFVVVVAVSVVGVVVVVVVVVPADPVVSAPELLARSGAGGAHCASFRWGASKWVFLPQV